MINVGVIGLGMMGNTHLDVYSKLGDRCRVVAISDIDPDLLVMGAFGTRTWKKRIFGSATSRLLQDCPCPIFIQR